MFRDPWGPLDTADVVFLGRASNGPTDSDGFLMPPVTFDVPAYDKGEGARQVQVDTGTFDPRIEFDGVRLHAGERWRIYARGDARGGTLRTSACDNSHRVSDALRAPRLRVVGRTVTAVPSTSAGRTSTRRVPQIRTRKSSIVVTAQRPVSFIRLMRGDTMVEGAVPTACTPGVMPPPSACFWRSLNRQWRLRVPRGTARLVVDTGDRSYAVRLTSLVTSPRD